MFEEIGEFVDENIVDPATEMAEDTAEFFEPATKPVTDFIKNPLKSLFG